MEREGLRVIAMQPGIGGQAQPGFGLQPKTGTGMQARAGSISAQQLPGGMARRCETTLFSGTFASPASGGVLAAVRQGRQAPQRTVVLTSADASFRQRLQESLTALRWHVRQASGGAEAMALLEEADAEALLLDSWLPDLEVVEFAAQLRESHPEMDLVEINGSASVGAPHMGRHPAARSPRRNELLHALRCAQDAGLVGVWSEAAQPDLVEVSAADADGIVVPVLTDVPISTALPAPVSSLETAAQGRLEMAAAAAPASIAESHPGLEKGTCSPADTGSDGAAWNASPVAVPFSKAQPTFGPRFQKTAGISGMDAQPARRQTPALATIPEMVGNGPAMLELARMVRLVAPRSTTVLLEGGTGSGKEVVARSLHRLGSRSTKPFTVLNCAAIPEALLEAELFGHRRGAFTGAVQSRTGRIEAAHGGTLFLDEIGEMAIGLQAKLLRFLECGELQRVGENEPVRVDVRVIAATHQPLEERCKQGLFRADLYYRLAVFPMRVPSLAERMEDLPLLASHFLARLGEQGPVKRLGEDAMRKLMGHNWPGNVRELAHVVERATILAEDRGEIGMEEIRFGSGRV